MYSPMSIEETETEDGDPVSDLTIASAEDNNVGQIETDGEEEPELDEDGDVYVQSPTPSLPSTHPDDLDALCPVLDTAEAETDEEELEEVEDIDTRDAEVDEEEPEVDDGRVRGTRARIKPLRYGEWIDSSAIDLRYKDCIKPRR